MKKANHNKSKLDKMYKRYTSQFKKGEVHLDKVDFANELRTRRSKKSHDVVMDIVRDTRYDYSAKQARSVKKAIERYNKMVTKDQRIKGITVTQIRKGNVPEEFKMALRSRYSELAAEGKSTEEARSIISYEFYGSPE